MKDWQSIHNLFSMQATSWLSQTLPLVLGQYIYNDVTDSSKVYEKQITDVSFLIIN